MDSIIFSVNHYMVGDLDVVVTSACAHQDTGIHHGKQAHSRA